MWLGGGGAACARCWAYLLTRSAWAVQDIVTESNQFDLVGFIPLLRERIYSNNQYARQFIISWVGTHGLLLLVGIPGLGRHQMSTVMCEHRDLSLPGLILSHQLLTSASLKRQLPVTSLLQSHVHDGVLLPPWFRALHSKLENTVQALLV